MTRRRPRWLRRPLRWALAHPTGRWVLLGGGVGVLCGFCAAIFEIAADAVAAVVLERGCGLPALLAASHPGSLSLAESVSLAGLVVAMAVGGLVAGLIIQRWSGMAKGGGTGVAVHAFHHGRGDLPTAAPWTKLAASVASLGTGASGGREGPISLIGAGLGAWAARRLGLTVRDRRILLAAGIAGGIAAVFRAPLAAAIFAAEVLYRGPDLEADVLIPAFIAAVVGYLAGTLGLDLLGPLAGHQGVLASTVFQAPAVAFRVADWPHLAGYTLVAGACALVARGFIGLQAGVTGRFDRLAVPFWIKPGIGAGIAGLVAVAVFLALATALGSRDEARIGLSTIGSGYGVVHWLFAGLGAPFHHLVLAGLLLVIALAKTLTTALCVGSGGSAGLFGPVIVIGGCTGGAIGLALEGLPVAPPMPACVLMGMAGLLAATHRTPVAALLMVAEIAGSYLLLLPAMWVSGTAFLLVGRRSLIGGQVDSPADSPAHRAEGMRGALADLRVADLLDPGTRSVVAPDLGIEQVQQRLTECPALAVVGADGRLHGLIDRDGLHGWAPDPYLRALIRAVDLADGAALALRPGDSVATALQRFRQHRVEVLAVTAGDGRFIGLLTAAALMGAIRDRMEPRP